MSDKRSSPMKLTTPSCQLPTQNTTPIWAPQPPAGRNRKIVSAPHSQFSLPTLFSQMKGLPNAPSHCHREALERLLSQVSFELAQWQHLASVSASEHSLPAFSDQNTGNELGIVDHACSNFSWYLLQAASGRTTGRENTQNVGVQRRLEPGTEYMGVLSRLSARRKAVKEVATWKDFLQCRHGRVHRY